MCSTDEKPELTSVMNDEKSEELTSAMSDEECALFEFTNESNSVEVGFLCWIQAPTNSEVQIDKSDLINKKTEIILF